MDIFEFAMKMEMDGKSFYEQQAATASSKELKEILLTLAEEEMKHFLFFKKLRDGETEDAAGELNGNTETLKKVQNIFVDMSNDKEKKTFGEDEIAAWTKALGIEEKAEKFYREKAEIEPDENKKRLLVLIAEEEQSHVHMIDGILTYLKFPEAFEDSAQFKNFQSLEGH
ncbi:MAG: ferritin family protein [bacterium]|nr:ferritin family protein [bacterium]